MAVTVANTNIIFRGPVTLITTEVTLDTSYNVGGEALTPSMFGLSEFTIIIPGSSEGYAVECIKSTPTAALLQAFAISGSTNTALEFASGLDRSGVTVDLLLVGH